MVKRNWRADFLGNPFIIFHHKMKKVKKALSQWSKDIFGNSFQEVIILEEISKVLEEQFEVESIETNMEKLHKA